MEEKKEERIEYKIYQIVCNETGEVYIGKTTRTLKVRLSQHKHLDCSSKQIILRGDYVMSQIDDCDTEEESIFLESYYIRNTDNCVNIHIPGRTMIEWIEENKDKIYKQRKIYREGNKELIKERNKIYREINKNVLTEKKKEYYEQNKDKILEKSKKYREAHKDEIEEKRKQKYTCECGSIINKVCKARHEKTKKHQNFINSK